MKFNTAKYTFFFLIIGGIFISPIFALMSGAFTLDSSEIQTWDFVKNSVLPEVSFRTFSLLFLTLIGTTLLALPLAFIMECFEFKGKRFFDICLYLPLAFPLYVLAFIYVGLFEWSSPVPTFLRELGLNSLGNLSVKNIFGVSFIFTIGLFPYLLIPIRFSLKRIPKNLLYSSLSLGRGNFYFLYKVVLPILFPALLSGLSIISMEVLADFGAVSVFNVDTLSTAIYTSWLSLYSLTSAIRISLVLLVFSVFFYYGNHYLNSRITYSLELDSPLKFELKSKYKPLLYCFLILLISFSLIIPLGQLLFWVLDTDDQIISFEYLNLFKNTAVIAFNGAALICLLSIAINFFERWHSQHKIIQVFKNMTLLGYALPGSLCGIAVFFLFKQFEDSLPVSLFSVLIFGLVFRFMAVAYRSMSSSLKLLPQKTEISSLSLGVGIIEYFKRIWLPFARNGIIFAFIFSFVEIAKEMPLTLMLRPFGRDTLATKLYEFTTEGEWERASIAALYLLVLTFISLLIGQLKKVKHD